MTDIEMIQELRKRGTTNGVVLGYHSGAMDIIADRFEELVNRNKELSEDYIIQKGLLDTYAASARSIKLNLKEFCEDDVPYPKMIADAARSASEMLSALNKIYICKENFEIDMYDDNGYSHEDCLEIKKGSLYILSNSSHRVVGGDIRLEGIAYSAHSWLEISEDTISDYFISLRSLIENIEEDD